MDYRSRLDNLDELRTFATIVEQGSLVRAASQLGVTPNAVSRRLSVLEARLGRRLIQRTTRKLSITDEGRVFYTRCRGMLDELRQAEAELLGDDGMDGTVRVGVHGDMIGPDLMGALGRVMQDAPELRMQLRSGFEDPIAAGLDLAIYVGHPPASSLRRVALGSLVWSLAAAPAYVARHGLPTGPTQLAAHECLRLVRDRVETHWKLSRGRGRPRRFAIGGRFETTSGPALAEALYAGMGIGVRLRPEIEAGSRVGTLVPVLPAWHWASTPVFALLPEGRSKRASVAAVLNALRCAAQSLAAPGNGARSRRA